MYTVLTYKKLQVKLICSKIYSWNLAFMLTAQQTTDICHGICAMITSCNASYTYISVEVVHRMMPSEPIIKSKSFTLLYFQQRLSKEEKRNYPYNTLN